MYLLCLRTPEVYPSGGITDFVFVYLHQFLGKDDDVGEIVGFQMVLMYLFDFPVDARCQRVDPLSFRRACREDRRIQRLVGDGTMYRLELVNDLRVEMVVHQRGRGVELSFRKSLARVMMDHIHDDCG